MAMIVTAGLPWLKGAAQVERVLPPQSRLEAMKLDRFHKAVLIAELLKTKGATVASVAKFGGISTTRIHQLSLKHYRSRSRCSQWALRYLNDVCEMISNGKEEAQRHRD